MVTIKDISRETGLGLATISRYLNGGKVKERNRVLLEQTIKQLGYTTNVLARGLKTNKTMSVGFIIPQLGDLFSTSIFSTAEGILRRSGYSSIICNSNSNYAQERDIVKFMSNKRVDGIIAHPLALDGDHLEPALAQKIPIVLVDTILPGLDGKVSAVMVDNEGGASQAVEILIEAGHRNIGIISGPREALTAERRLMGYCQAMSKNNLPIRDEYIVHSDYSVDGGYKSMCKLMHAKDLSAVFATNYNMVMGAVVALNEHDIQIPNQLSIVGYDYHYLARVIRPNLTTITQPVESIGEIVAEILIDAMTTKNEVENKVVTLPTGVRLGNSVARV